VRWRACARCSLRYARRWSCRALTPTPTLNLTLTLALTLALALALTLALTLTLTLALTHTLSLPLTRHCAASGTVLHIPDAYEDAYVGIGLG